MAMVILTAMVTVACFEAFKPGPLDVQQLVCPAFTCPIAKCAACADNPLPNGSVVYSPDGKYTFQLSLEDDFLVCVQAKGNNGTIFTAPCIKLGELREVILSYRAEEGKR